MSLDYLAKPYNLPNYIFFQKGKPQIYSNCAYLIRNCGGGSGDVDMIPLRNKRTGALLTPSVLFLDDGTIFTNARINDNLIQPVTTEKMLSRKRPHYLGSCSNGSNKVIQNKETLLSKFGGAAKRVTPSSSASSSSSATTTNTQYTIPGFEFDTDIFTPAS